MRKIIICLLLVSMFFATFSVAFAENNVIYVSPTGDDSNDGKTVDSAVATFTAARDRARNIEGNVTVYFMGGEYKWTDDIALTQQDSNVTYCAYEGEKPVFQAGYKIPYEMFGTETLSNGTRVKTFDMKSYLEEKLGKELSQYDERFYPMTKNSYGTNERPYLGRVMYSVDNEPALWLARYPNKKEAFYEDNPHTTFMTTGAVIKETNAGNGDTEGSMFRYTDERISNYSGVEDAWFYGYPKWLFNHEELKISMIDGGNKLIETATAPAIGISEGREFIIFNILEELDQKGEYYVSKDGIVYVYDSGFSHLNLTGFDIYKSNSQNSNGINAELRYNSFIRLSGASNVTFEGLTFENSRGNGILVEGGEDVRIDNCNFYNISGNAVVLGMPIGGAYTPFASSDWDNEKYEIFYGLTTQDAKIDKQINTWLAENRSVAVRGKNHGIYNSTVKNTGLSGINLSGGNPYRDEDCNFTVENCDVSFAGVNKRTYAPGIKLDNAHGITVKNNKVGRCPSQAISGYSTKAVIENNEIYDGMSESYDNGLIYMNYITPSLDITINNNYIHDVAPEFPIENPNSTASQRSGIAFDNIYGCGVKITNNIIENIPRGIYVNSGATVSNNIFIDSFDPIVTYTWNNLSHWNIDKIGGNKDDFFSSENDALYGGVGDTSGLSYMETWPIFGSSDLSKAQRAIWEEKYPEVTAWADIVMNQSHNGKMFFKIHNNLFVNTYGYWWYNHRKLGDNITASKNELNGLYESEISKNVYRTDTKCFKTFEKGDYELTYSARAKYGIKPIDTSVIGIK